jgi:hypothetical protein
MTLLLRHIQIVHVPNKIAGASVTFAIGLASAEFAKSLTLDSDSLRPEGVFGMYAIFGRE